MYCKAFDDEVIYSFQILYQFMQDNYQEVNIFVDKWIIDTLKVCQTKKDPRNKPIINEGKLPLLFENKDEEDRMKIDFIITLGGDGTILWAAKQFHQKYVPPLISFAHGSLGYLCNYAFDEHSEVLNSILCYKCKVNLDERLRLKVSCPKKPERDIFRGNDL